MLASTQDTHQFAKGHHCNTTKLQFQNCNTRDLGGQLTTFMECSGHEMNLNLIVGLQFVSLLNWDFSNHIWSQTILGNHTLRPKKNPRTISKNTIEKYH